MAKGKGQATISFFRAGLLAGFVFIFVAGALSSSLFKDLPPLENFGESMIKQSTKIYDRTGKILLYEIHGEERRTKIPFSEIPDIVKKATLAAEDINFYSHPAYDLRGIFRGVVLNPSL
ncbi:MAG: transglycosylase domain-containing protein, partial [Candidatus Paceibacteria bacterium]